LNNSENTYTKTYALHQPEWHENPVITIILLKIDQRRLCEILYNIDPILRTGPNPSYFEMGSIYKFIYKLSCHNRSRFILGKFKLTIAIIENRKDFFHIIWTSYNKFWVVEAILWDLLLISAFNFFSFPSVLLTLFPWNYEKWGPKGSSNITIWDRCVKYGVGFCISAYSK